MDDNLIEFPMAEEEAPRLEPPAPEGMKVVLLAVDSGRYDAERSLDELRALAEANGMEPVAEVMQKRNNPDVATALGKGRLAEAKMLAHNMGAGAAIYDGELSGSQIRNIDAALGIPVIDRTMLILEIFAKRATTHEGKLQTELATLEYRLPRLAGLGTALSRQGGGGGGGAGARRGGGETKLEYDRRYIRRRITVLKKRLAEVRERRDESRRKRGKSGVPLIALVGYTNVGKSSLLNALTGSEVGVADMLFATLDPTARALTLPDGQHAVLIDTVGFVSRLPHNLVEAFKSTLEEAKYADLLVKVCDAADPDAADQLATTDEVLASLGAGGEPLIVYNKCDLVQDFIPFDPAALKVSAATGEGLPELLEAFSAALAHRVMHVHVLLPYSQLALADVLRRHGNIEVEEFRDEGVYIEAGVKLEKAHLFEPYLYKQEPTDEDPG